jgi:plastocyanin
MRKLLVTCIALCAALGVAGGTLAGASAPEKKKPPVKLDGAVTNKGTKTAKGGKITITTRDFFFKPTFIKAKAGEALTVTVKNNGNAPHTFTADDGAFDETLQPGDEVTVEVTIPTDGSPLVFHCDFHSGQGMQGAFFVKAGTSSAGGSTPASTSPPGGGNTGY